MKRVIDIISEPCCEVIKPIQVNYDLIEVDEGQCWSVKRRTFIEDAISESDVGRITPRAYCKYDPSTPPIPRYFREILENSLSGPEIQSFCHYFLKLLEHHGKKHKDRVPCLVGDSNSGKTSLFLPILGVIHYSRVATITKQGAFNKAMITPETQVVFLDEATTSLLKIDDWKTITQGGFAALKRDVSVLPNTIDPGCPFKWLEFCVASRTVGFTRQFEKNDRVITSLFTARTKFVDSSSTTLNFC